MNMKRIMVLLAVLLPLTMLAQSRKREFRGAWIQCVNGQFQGMGTQKMQQTLTYQLDELQKDGANAIIFQVRPAADALYESKLEPWSHFLTGVQGKAPVPYWDPLQWMVEQCHRRGMELHAWINPYRAKTKSAYPLASNHIAMQHPGWAYSYDGLIVMNPALQENRDYICRVVEDIVSRYDVDGLHIDDYFYPYPVAGVNFPDDADFRANPQGYANRGDWRRHQVNLLIEQLDKTIHRVKPWVKFGVSPFGIYRNKANDPMGSKTRGLQNYDDLYADVLTWINKGWVDYTVPQIYWQIGHPTADYEELIYWWNENASRRPLFIGEDVERTVKYADVKNPAVNQLPAKMRLHSQLEGVKGTVLWYAKAAVDNVGNYGTNLRTNYWKTLALQPEMPHLGKKAPGKVKRAKILDMDGQHVLFWTAPKAGRNWQQHAVKYVVYRFARHERINLDDASHIVAITSATHYRLPMVPAGNYYYVVTALNRLEHESRSVKVKYNVR